MPGDPYTAPPPARPFASEVGAPTGRLRIGVMRRAPRGMPLDPECLAAVDRMARVLADCGHAMEESYPEALDDHESVQHYVTVVSSNVARALERGAASSAS
jgi:amidase